MSDYGLNISNDALEEIAAMKFPEGTTKIQKLDELKRILNVDDIDYDSFKKAYDKEKETRKVEGVKYNFNKFAKDLLADNLGYKTIINPKDLFNLADDYKPCIIL